MIRRCFVRRLAVRAPRRRGPAKILDIDRTAVTAKFQSRTFKLAMICVRKKMESKDVSAVKWDSAFGALVTWDGVSLEDSGNVRGNFDSPLGGNGDPDTLIATPPNDNSSVQVSGPSSLSPCVVQVPGSPTLYVQLPSPPPPPIRSRFRLYLPPLTQICTSS